MDSYYYSPSPTRPPAVHLDKISFGYTSIDAAATGKALHFQRLAAWRITPTDSSGCVSGPVRLQRFARWTWTSTLGLCRFAVTHRVAKSLRPRMADHGALICRYSLRTCLMTTWRGARPLRSPAS